MQEATLSFRLSDGDVERMVAQLPDPWEGNTFGHTVFLSKYSRKKADGTKETWADVVRRCVEGSYSIQRDWCVDQMIPWSDSKARVSALEMFSRMYTFKFTPPGRGLWMMGTEFVHNRLGSAALQNCAFVSTQDDIIRAAEFLMEASMLGVGVGFDTLAADRWRIARGEGRMKFVIPDSREGWVASVSRLLKFYLDGGTKPVFDYREIRPKGEPIKGFGGLAAGPDPLIRLHQQITDLFGDRADGDPLTHRDVTDLMNMIGMCVVAGNVRRSAEIAIGPPVKEYLHLKDYDPKTGEAFHPVAEGRVAHGWASNNSVFAHAGMDYQEVQDLNIRTEGVGLLWLDTAREYGRTGDAPNNRDYRAGGTNPCGEQTLESYEMCNLVETYPSNHDSMEDYLRTLKFAYLYAKSVTLLPTHWPETNAIMLRNRRIGASITGAFQFAEEHGLPVFREWMRRGYEELQRWDTIYSEWLCVRPSIKTTSIKPSGTLSKMVKSKFQGQWYAGITPGVHAPVATHWIQHMILDQDDPVLHALSAAGYEVEPRLVNVAGEWTADSSGSMVVAVPIQGPPVRTQDEVSMWEKAAFASLIQREWADNQVSVTIDFDPDTEGHQIASMLHAYEGQLKSVSFLKRQRDGEESHYPQLPMDRQPLHVVQAYQEQVQEPNFTLVYEGVFGIEAQGERYCDTDTCEVTFE